MHSLGMLLERFRSIFLGQTGISSSIFAIDAQRGLWILILISTSFIFINFSKSYTHTHHLSAVYYTHFVTFAALWFLIDRTRIGNWCQEVCEQTAQLLTRRGAFSSDPAAEAPKFAIIRILFGMYILNRATTIAQFMPASDWESWNVAPFILLDILLAFLLIFGLFTQVALYTLILFQWQIGQIFTATMTLSNDIAAMLAVVLLFANAGAHYSVDMYLRRSRLLSYFMFYYRDGLPTTSTLQLVKVIALGTYWSICVYSLAQHLNEPAWMNGTAGPYLLSNNYQSRYSESFAYMFSESSWSVLLARLSLWLMLPWYILVLPAVIWGGYARLYVIIWGLLFFALSRFVLNLAWLAEFEFLLFASLFWQTSFIRGAGNLKMAYDDRCNLCDRTVAFIKFMDLFGRVELKPISSNKAWFQANNIDEAAALKDLHGLDEGRSGRISSGYDFYIELTRNVFLLTPLYPILLVGKLLRVGPKIYRFIADRRTKIFGVCHMPTKRPDPYVYALRESQSKSDRCGTFIATTFTYYVICNIAYFCTTPASFIGWSGVQFPDFVQRRVSLLSQSAHFFGMTPIDVFNKTDLKMAENWFTLSVAGPTNEKELLPVFRENGTRLHLTRSPRVYFGFTTRFRRGIIKDPSCAYTRFEKKIKWLASHSVYGERKDAVVLYRQYHQNLPSEDEVLAGRYPISQITVTCQKEFVIGQ